MAEDEDGIARPGRAQTLGETRLGEEFAGETFHADLKGQRSYHDFLRARQDPRRAADHHRRA